MLINSKKITCLAILFAMLWSLFSPAFTNTTVSAATYCNLRETRTFHVAGEVRIGNFTSNEKNGTVLYQPNPGWTIIDFKVTETLKFGKTSNTTQYIQAGSRFISKQELNQASEQIAKHNGEFEYEEFKVKANAYFEKRMKQYYAAVNEFSSSHQAIQVLISAQGHGALSDKTSGIGVSIDGKVMCIGEPDKEAFVEKLTGEIDTQVFPFAVVCIYNNASRPVKFNYHWEGGKTETTQLPSGKATWFHWKYSSEGLKSPNFLVEFDKGNGTKGAYQLKRIASPASECQRGKKYQFLSTNNSGGIELYEMN